jgi:hypothetical protein
MIRLHQFVGANAYAAYGTFLLTDAVILCRTLFFSSASGGVFS